MNLNELSETQSKIITDRINHTEKNMNILLESMQACNRKEARYRDKTDELSKVMKTLAEGYHNESSRCAMDEISNSIVHLADIEDTKIMRIEEKIIGELLEYELKCRNTREEVKHLVAMRDREIAKRKSIEMNKRTHHENEIMLSNIQLSKILKELYQVAETFEKQKLSDMKEILTNFILIQLKYHSTGLEIFSNAFDIVTNRFDEKSDLEHFTTEVKKINRQFKKHLESENKTSNKFKFMRAFNMFSHSTSNLDRIGKRDKRRSMGKSQSTMSLNSIESEGVDDDDVGKEKDSQSAEMDTKTSDLDTDSDIDKSTTDQSDTITEEISIANHPQPSKNMLTRVKHAK